VFGCVLVVVGVVDSVSQGLFNDFRVEHEREHRSIGKMAMVRIIYFCRNSIFQPPTCFERKFCKHFNFDGSSVKYISSSPRYS